MLEDHYTGLSTDQCNNVSNTFLSVNIFLYFYILIRQWVTYKLLHGYYPTFRQVGNLLTTTHGYYPTCTYSTNKNNSNNKSIRPPIKLPPKRIWQGYPGKLVALAHNQSIELLQLTNPENMKQTQTKTITNYNPWTIQQHYKQTITKNNVNNTELVVTVTWHTVKLTHQDPTSSSPSGSVLNEDGMSGMPAIPQLLTSVVVLTLLSTRTSIFQSFQNDQDKLPLCERLRETEVFWQTLTIPQLVK